MKKTVVVEHPDRCQGGWSCSVVINSLNPKTIRNRKKVTPKWSQIFKISKSHIIQTITVKKRTDGFEDISQTKTLKYCNTETLLHLKFSFILWLAFLPKKQASALSWGDWSCGTVCLRREGRWVVGPTESMCRCGQWSSMYCVDFALFFVDGEVVSIQPSSGTQPCGKLSC